MKDLELSKDKNSMGHEFLQVEILAGASETDFKIWQEVFRF